MSSSARIASFEALRAQTDAVMQRLQGGTTHMSDKELLAHPLSNRYVMSKAKWGAHDREIMEDLTRHNMKVYETRVAKAYVNESLARGLYLQKVQDHHNMQRNRHQNTIMDNRTLESSVLSPRTRKIRADAKLHSTLVELMERDTPHFNDLDLLMPNVDRNQLSRRGLPESLTAYQRAASPIELSRSVKLPPISSLMNPRNQMTSPLPDLAELKRDLLPTNAERKPSAHESRKLGKLHLMHLLPTISKLCYKKRSADVQRHDSNFKLDQSSSELTSMAEVIYDFMAHEHGLNQKIVAERTEQLRASCSPPPAGHGNHPRVEVFRQMAGLGLHEEDHPEPFPPEKENALMQLFLWLRIAVDDPPANYGRDTRMLLEVRDMRKLVDHLRRLNLIPAEAVPFFKQLGESLRLPPAELFGALSSSASTTQAVEVQPEIGDMTSLQPAPPISVVPHNTGAMGVAHTTLTAEPASPTSTTMPEMGLSRKVDADELLLVWMNNWEGWVDECLKPGYKPVV